MTVHLPWLVQSASLASPAVSEEAGEAQTDLQLPGWDPGAALLPPPPAQLQNGEPASTGNAPAFAGIDAFPECAAGSCIEMLFHTFDHYQF